MFKFFTLKWPPASWRWNWFSETEWFRDKYHFTSCDAFLFFYLNDCWEFVHRCIWIKFVVFLIQNMVSANHFSLSFSSSSSFTFYSICNHSMFTFSIKRVNNVLCFWQAIVNEVRSYVYRLKLLMRFLTLSLSIFFCFLASSMLLISFFSHFPSLFLPPRSSCLYTYIQTVDKCHAWVVFPFLCSFILFVFFFHIYRRPFPNGMTTIIATLKGTFYL